MNTRIINGIVLAVIVAAIAFINPAASAASEPTVQVSEYQVSPAIMMPDTLGTITVVLKNTATSAQQKENSGLVASEFVTSTVTDINVNINNVHLEGMGITVLSKDFDRVGALGPGQSIPMVFTIRSPTTSGMYYPEVWIDTAGQGKSTRYPIPVNVNTPVGIQKQAILSVSSTLPGSVNPGDEIPVTVTVKNTGETMADDVILRVLNISTIAPKVTDLYHIGPVDAKTEKAVVVELVSDRNTDPGLIRIPVTMMYKWIDGSAHTDSTSIDIVLKGEAELGLVSVDTSPRRVPANQPFDLTMRIENTGTGEAKQVAATVDLPMTGTRQAFIGKIKEGNDAPALFLLDGVKGGTYDYTATITHIDDLGEHTITKPMSLRVEPEDMSGLAIIVLVVLAVAGFLGYRYWYLPRKNGNGALPWVKKELKVAFLLAIRSLQRGSRSSAVLTILIVGMCFTNMIFLPSLFNGIGKGITQQIVDYEISNVLVSPKSGDQYIPDLDATLDLINGMPGVQRAAPQYSKGSTFSFRQRNIGVGVRAVKPKEEMEVSPVYTKMVAGTYLGDGDTGEVIIGQSLAGSASVRQEDEFQPSLGGVRVGDSITIEFGNGYRKDYRVKGIYFTGWSPVDSGAYITWTDMELVEGKALDKADSITVKAKPGYSEQFIEDELISYGVGVTGHVQTTGDLLEKNMGRVLQKLAIINMVSLIVSIIITTVVLFIVITIKTLNSRKQIGILKAIGVDKEVIMHSYGFQVMILGILGILLGVILTVGLAAWMSVHPIVTPEWSAYMYVTPMDLLTNSVILFLAALIAGYVPAYQVSRENIQTAMRA